MTQEEAVMKRLTAEEIAELERLPYSRGHAMVAYGDMCALLAMASRLVEIESALEFLDVYCRVDLVGQARHLPANTQNALALARELGWTSPTQKPNDGGGDA